MILPKLNFYGTSNENIPQPLASVYLLTSFYPSTNEGRTGSDILLFVYFCSLFVVLRILVFVLRHEKAAKLINGSSITIHCHLSALDLYQMHGCSGLGTEQNAFNCTIPGSVFYVLLKFGIWKRRHTNNETV